MARLGEEKVGSGDGRLHQLVQAQKLAAWNEARAASRTRTRIRSLRFQLSAERIAKKFKGGDDDLQLAVEEGPRPSSPSDDAQEDGGRVLAIRAHAGGAHAPRSARRDPDPAAALYSGVKPGVSVSVSVDPDIELLMDPEQIARAVGNL